MKLGERMALSELLEVRRSLAEQLAQVDRVLAVFGAGLPAHEVLDLRHPPDDASRRSG